MRRLWSWIVELDRILRGEATRVADLRTGTIHVPLGIWTVLVLLGMLYGACMGCYAVVNHENSMQMLASMVKVPALFMLTLAVTFPSLYVFNALVGSRLYLASLVRLFLASLGVNLAVLSSLGPIVAFFSVNTASYGFMVLLNVLVFAIAGLLSLVFLLQTLHRLHVAPRTARRPALGPAACRDELPQPAVADDVADAAALPPTEGEIVAAEIVADPTCVEQGPLEPITGYVLGRHVKLVFSCWMIVFGLVGAQMSWVLRPFIGAPNLPFEWFRPRESNFFEAVWHAIDALLR